MRRRHVGRVAVERSSCPGLTPRPSSVRSYARRWSLLPRGPSSLGGGDRCRCWLGKGWGRPSLAEGPGCSRSAGVTVGPAASVSARSSGERSAASCCRSASSRARQLVDFGRFGWRVSRWQVPGSARTDSEPFRSAREPPTAAPPRSGVPSFCSVSPPCDSRVRSPTTMPARGLETILCGAFQPPTPPMRASPGWSAATARTGAQRRLAACP